MVMSGTSRNAEPDDKMNHHHHHHHNNNSHNPK